MAKSRKPRILLSTRIMRGLSGKVTLLKHNVEALSAAGWEVSFFAEKIDKALMSNIGADPITLWNKPFPKSYRLKRFMNKHERLARSGQYDIVAGHGETLVQDVLHVHNCRHLENEVLIGKPLLPGMKDTADLQTRQIREKCYTRLVANSQLMRNEFVSRFGADPGNIDVVYPGYDPARFRVNPANEQSRLLKESLGAENDVLLGLITSGKLKLRGADLLIPAIAQLPDSLRKRLRVIVVAKDDAEPFRQQAENMGLADRVHFLPPRPDVEVFYNALDIFVNPARFETFGMALLEAMACGVACITAQKNVGAAELFKGDLHAGLLTDTSPEAFAETIKPFIETESARKNHAALCLQAASPLDWDCNTRRHLEIYEHIFQEKQLKRT